MAGEYEEFVSGLAKQPIDPYTSIDERLDFLGPKIVDALNQVKKVEATMGITPEAEIEQIPFAYSLAIAGLPGSGVTLTEYASFSGYIKQVSIHWPRGCNALVDVKVGHGTKQFCPREGFLALNDVTPTYPFNIPVNQGDEIWVEMRNGDGANPHNIAVTIILEGALP